MTKNDFIFGVHPINEALLAGENIDKILIRRGTNHPILKKIKQFCAENEIPINEVPIEKLNNITRKNHQDIIAFLSPITFYNIADIIPLIYEKGETPLVLILDKITDVGNFGAIIRTAECAGVHTIIIPSKGAARISSDTIKTSTGAIFNMHICREHNLKDCIKFLKESGLNIVSCTEKKENKYTNINFVQPTAIILGAEDKGISPEYLKLSDEFALIPMTGKTTSLNVSVSAAILIYEAIRQRSISI